MTEDKTSNQQTRPSPITARGLLEKESEQQIEVVHRQALLNGDDVLGPASFL
jgi:hypothetical protein